MSVKYCHKFAIKPICFPLNDDYSGVLFPARVLAYSSLSVVEASVCEEHRANKRISLEDVEKRAQWSVPGHHVTVNGNAVLHLLGAPACLGKETESDTLCGGDGTQRS